MSRDSAAAIDLLSYINASPSPFHCVTESVRRLQEAGFIELIEGEPWGADVPEKYYVVRNGSTIAAFKNTRADLANGILIAGAHTDSPCLRLRDQGEFSAHSYRQWGIEVYGGVIHHTWLDRDLGVAGRLVVRDGKGRRSVLVSSSEPLLRVPNLAIHLNRDINKKCSFNPQTELSPIAAQTDGESLLPRLAELATVKPTDILATELYLHSVEPCSFWGVNREFIAAPRLDNQAMSHAILSGFLEAADKDPGQLCVALLYDNEECGSQTPQGAMSNFLLASLERLAEVRGADRTALLDGLAKGLFISADMAHALHPNFTQAHDREHAPAINGGPVIKSNANFRYATDARSAAAFLDICGAAGVPCQNFVNRADLGCGSTIGPMTAATLGMRTVDVGTPQFAMHSIRESAGADDPAYINAVFKQFYSVGPGPV